MGVNTNANQNKDRPASTENILASLCASKIK